MTRRGNGRNRARRQLWPRVIEALEGRLLLDGVSFAGRIDLPTGYLVYPRSVTAADFDGDGILDLAVGMHTGVIGPSDTVRVYLSREGTYSIRDYTTGTNPWALCAADLNGDGKTDLAVVGTSSRTISIFLNKGDGTFASKVDYATGSSPSSIAAADLNRDGSLDLAVANNNTPGTVSIFVNNGNGTFKARTDYATGKQPVSVVCADFSDDGSADLAVANGTERTITVLLNNGNGVFGGRADYPSVGGAVEAADLNGDGWVDLTAAGGKAVVLLNNRDGTFSPKIDYATSGSAAFARVADFDADGSTDVAYADSTAGSVGILMNDGHGVLSSGGSVAGFKSPGPLVAADLNGDSRTDLAVVDQSGTVTILFNALFAPRSDFPTPIVPSAVAAADLNHDGYVDLATANDGSVSVLLGSGAGTFGPRVDYPAGRYACGIVAADFDRDGAVDLASASVVARAVSVLLNDGSGGFLAAADYAAGDRLTSLAAADFNNDGFIDLAAADGASNTVNVLLNRRNGTFAATVSYASGALPNSLTAADFNGDGWADIATANNSTSNVSLFINNRDGTFQPKLDISAGNHAVSIVAADVNSDGNIDLATANDDFTVSIIQNTGNAVFAPKVDYPADRPSGLDARPLVASDFNGDGRIDLAFNAYSAFNTDSEFVCVLLNQPDGAFRKDVAYPTGKQPRGLAVADFNLDNRPDLAVTSGGHNVVSILPNAVSATPLRIRDNSQVYLTRNSEYVSGWYDTAAIGSPEIVRGLGVTREIVSEFTPGDDVITLDFSSGNFIPPGGLSIDGGAGIDTVIFKGLWGPIDLTKIAGLPITYSNIEKIAFADGAVSLASLPPGVGLVATGTAQVTLTQPASLPSLDIDAAASVILAPGGTNALRITGPVNIGTPATKGTGFVGLNLADNPLIVQTSDPAARKQMLDYLSALIKQARTKNPAEKLWQGDGITTSAAPPDDTGITGLAIVANAVFDPVQQKEVPLYPATWQGQSVDINSILVKYTLNGDVNVDGLVNFDDYYRLNTGFLSNGALGGYQNGDLNFDGIINFDDYYLINTAFLGQGATPMSAPAAAVAAPSKKLRHELPARQRARRHSPRRTRIHSARSRRSHFLCSTPHSA